MQKKAVLAVGLATLVIFSTYINQVPLIFADYGVEHASFPPDFPGDVVYDGKVDLKDYFLVCKCYGSSFGDAKWDPRADINDDGKIDLVDVMGVSKLFGEWYNISTTPVAYSTSFEFNVPNDGDETVWYYVLVRVWVPAELSGQEFYLFPDWVDDWIINVRIDNTLKYQGSTNDPPCLPPANILLGSLGGGCHMLEFSFVEKWLGGKLHFCVSTVAGNCAWLDRFRVYVPNYSANEYRYTVRTPTWFPLSDRYFIRGFADDYIDDIKLGGGWLFQDWQWSTFETLYSWGDGFNVPTGYLDPPDTRDIELTLGVISGGLLDFLVLSFTKQPKRIARGTPEFWASVMALAGFNQKLLDKKLYAGSNWCGDPGLSERKIIVSQELYIATYAYTGGPLLWDARVRFDFGIAWLDWEIDSDTSFGITINMTYLGGVEKPVSSLHLNHVDIGVSVPSQALDVLCWEFKDQHGGKSIVNSDFKIAATMIVVAGATFASSFFLPVGATVGIAAAVTMINGMFEYVKDTQEAPFKDYATREHDAWASVEQMGPAGVGQSVSEVAFLRVKPSQATHCGMVEVKVDGTIEGTRVFTYINFPVYVS